MYKIAIYEDTIQIININLNLNNHVLCCLLFKIIRQKLQLKLFYQYGSIDLINNSVLKIEELFKQTPYLMHYQSL